MQSSIQQHFLQSINTTKVYIYILPIQLVVQHIKNFKNYSIKNFQEKITISYFVIIKQLSTFMRIQKYVLSLEKQLQLYNFNIVLFENRQEINEHMEMMKKMSGDMFSSQYVQMIDLLNKQIQVGLIKQYCLDEFAWSQIKCKNFIQKEGVNSLVNFFKYPRFNTLESLKIKGLWAFIQYYNKEKK